MSIDFQVNGGPGLGVVWTSRSPFSSKPVTAGSSRGSSVIKPSDSETAGHELVDKAKFTCNDNSHDKSD